MEREDNLLAAFPFFGKDGSGYITIIELQQACKNFGLSEIPWEDIFKEIDQDNVDLLSSISNSHKVDDLVIVHRISIEDILQGAEREMQMIVRHRPLTIFREEELRKFIGIKNIEMNHFVIECGCKSLKCGDIMGHLKIFGRRLEITCKCSADCKEEVDLKW